MGEVFNPNKPSDAAIVAVLSERFMVDGCVIVAWLKQFDARAETERQASIFQVPSAWPGLGPP